MENDKFNSYEFENLLTEQFFDCNERHEISRLITEKLNTDDEFRNQYELWLEDSCYTDWNEFYQELKNDEKAAWGIMFPDGNEDDSITDYLTRE